MKTRLGILLIALFLPILGHAQLVADGQTNILSGVVSNISQLVTVGSNESFTLLVVTNGSVLSSPTNGVVIGVNSSARSNLLIVTGSQWLGPAVILGEYGSGNEMDILNGGIVSDGGSLGSWIGTDPGANSNLAVVSGSGSAWTNLSEMGYAGSFNTLVVSNGGQVFSHAGSTSVGEGPPSSGNRAIITGAGSLWENDTPNFYLGEFGSSNQLLVTDSGTFVVAGWLWVGYNSNTKYNQLTVSNSGVVTVGDLIVGNFESSNSASNSVAVDGGIVTVTNLTDVYNGSQFIFNGGTLQSVAMSYAGTVPFVVGNGTNTAVYTMLGGTHGFFLGPVISSNAVLNGSGTLLADVSVNNGGTIAPGTNNLATIVENYSLILNPGSTTLMKLNASDSASDAITGMSNLVYGGTLRLTNISGSYSDGQSFSLFAATNYSGAFATLAPASPGAGLRWDTNELSIDGTLRVFSTATPPPVFGSVTAANGNLLVRASGGIPYDPCCLLTSTNLAAPVSDWSCGTTNYFDSTGATTFTNGISAGQTQQYFRLQVN